MEEYSLHVDGFGNVRASNRDSGTKESTGRIHVDDRVMQWLDPFDISSRDLLRVATALFHVDRLCPRKAAAGAARTLQWQRKLVVRIDVEDPARWTAALEKLTDLLTFLTDDRWEIRFCAAKRHAPQTRPLFPDHVTGDLEIALFSGGLDSVAGLASRFRETKRLMVPVSVYGIQVRRQMQEASIAALRKRGIDLHWLRFQHSLRAARGSQLDKTQRTRGILFLAVAAAMARALGTSRFSTYEAGPGAFNVPLNEAQIASHNTRAMHPLTLHLAEKLFRTVIDDSSITIEAPFLLKTKADVCASIADELPPLARISMSCDETERAKKLDNVEHCGLCTSCLFRRVAVWGTLGHDPSSYRPSATRKHGHYDVNALRNCAERLLAAGSFAGCMQIDPALRHAVPYLSEHRGISRDEAERAVWGVLERHAKQVLAFLDRSSFTVPPIRPPRARTHAGGGDDLFAHPG